MFKDGHVVKLSKSTSVQWDGKIVNLSAGMYGTILSLGEMKDHIQTYLVGFSSDSGGLLVVIPATSLEPIDPPKELLDQYSSVELTHDMMSDKTIGDPVLLRKGQRGVIVEVYTRPSVPYPGYEVEFFDDSGDTIALMTLREEDIRIISKREKP